MTCTPAQRAHFFDQLPGFEQALVNDGIRVIKLWFNVGRPEQLRRMLERERAQPAHGERLARDRARRDKAQAAYVEEFRREVLAFLAFAPRHAAVGLELATRIAEHATPVGSGTVARTARIPVAERAEAGLHRAGCGRGGGGIDGGHWCLRVT